MRDVRLFLDDIIESTRKIREYVDGMTFADYAADEKTQDAVLRNLEIIGEAVGKLPEDITGEKRHIEWHKIKALRNVVIHEYFGLDEAIIWDVVQNKLEDLRTACLDLLGEE